MTRRLISPAVMAIVFCLIPSFARAAVQGYYRMPTVHGDQIVFMCEGDLWKVSTNGGDAMRLTSHPATESYPHFSPDGKWIAFTADYQGNEDVYVMPSDGGEPRRLTYHPSGEYCAGWTPDGKYVLFHARRSGLDSDDTMYKVPAEGGDAEKINIGVCGAISYSADQKNVAFNQFTWGGTWKRYRGGTTPKIWVGDLATNQFHKIEPDPKLGDAVDQYPMWVGDRIYFVSERKFPVNIWSIKPDGTDAKQMTHHTDYDVRSIDSDGKLVVYNVGADLYLLDVATGQSQKVDITLPSDRIRERERVEDASKTLESYGLSKDGKRVVVSSRGQLWNSPAKPGGRIIEVTDDNSAIRQRASSFSPDGKKILCITDETGEQELALFDAAGKEPHKILTKHANGYLFPPIWSDDGKHIAFADMTGTLYTCDPDSGETKKIDQDTNSELTEYSFSPDSKWIAYTKVADNRTQGIHICELATGKVTDVSAGFTNDYSPTWDPAGKYLFFLSNRIFNPILDELDRSFLVTKTAKPCVVVLAKGGKSPFLPEEVLDADKEKKADKSDDGAATKPATKDSKADEAKADDAGDDDEDSDADASADHHKKAGDKKVKDLKIDVEDIQQRVVEFPIPADNCNELNAAKNRVYWVSSPTNGMADDDEDMPRADRRTRNHLNVYDFKKRKHEVLLTGIGGYTLSRDGSKMGWEKDREILVADSSSKPGDDIEEKVDLHSLPLEVNPADEWKQIFAEAWRLQRDFYWAQNMVGVDWPAMKAKYELLLPRVSTRGELNDVIGQLIGELGTSHTYVFGGDNSFLPPNPTPVGVLGADVEVDQAAGLHRFVKVYRPEVWETYIDAPLAQPHADVHEGDYLLAINGHPLSPTDNADSKLTNLAEVQVLLTVCSKADKSDARDIQIETLASDEKLRYADWCRRNREYVDQKTGGKIGYFHLPDMGAAGLVKFIEDFYPQFKKDALIIDERDNHGGFISQMLIEKLNRKIWAYDKPRRGMMSSYPEVAAPGYKCVLINEHAGSDGDIFPDSFRTLGLGPLIGKRTWGGVIGIRMDKGFVDNGLSSQPEFAWWDARRGWSIENHGVDPDIEVDYRPEDYIAKRDPQLDRAIEEMQKMLQEHPIQRPVAPPLPIRVHQEQANGN